MPRLLTMLIKLIYARKQCEKIHFKGDLTMLKMTKPTLSTCIMEGNYQEIIRHYFDCHGEETLIENLTVKCFKDENCILDKSYKMVYGVIRENTNGEWDLVISNIHEQHIETISFWTNDDTIYYRYRDRCNPLEFKFQTENLKYIVTLH